MPPQGRDIPDEPQPLDAETEPSIWPPPPTLFSKRLPQMASTLTALGAVIAGFAGNVEWMLWLACASIVLNLLSLAVDGGWVMETEPGIGPPPPPPPKAMLRMLQLTALLTMIAGAGAGARGQDETLLILATTSFAANGLSLWLEGVRRNPPRHPPTVR